MAKTWLLDDRVGVLVPLVTCNRNDDPQRGKTDSRRNVLWLSQIGKSTLGPLAFDSSHFSLLDGPRYLPRPSRRSLGFLERSRGTLRIVSTGKMVVQEIA